MTPAAISSVKNRKQLRSWQFSYRKTRSWPKNIFNQDNQISPCSLTVSSSRTGLRSIFTIKPKTNRNGIRSFGNKTVFIDQNSTTTLVVLSSPNPNLRHRKRGHRRPRSLLETAGISYCASTHIHPKRLSSIDPICSRRVSGSSPKGSVIAKKAKISFRIINENISRSSASTALSFHHC